MHTFLTQEQIDDLLDNVIGVDKRVGWKGTKQQFTCPIHNESNPSCGINSDYIDKDGVHSQVFHCFSCGKSGTLDWFLYKSMPDKFRSVERARRFINDRYKIKMSHRVLDDDSPRLKRYGDSYTPNTLDINKINSEENHRSMLAKLAIFKSGKETYKYFFDRGFTKEDMIKFKIGRDLESETVTIPVFDEDNNILGIIGRYIDPKRPKNMRFKIYSFPKGSTVFPLNFLNVENDTIIGVESMLDCMKLHKWGYTNAVAFMGDSISSEQAEIISSKCKKFIALFDNDKGGAIAHKIAKKRLSGKVMYLKPTYYPEFGKDPCDWGKKETIKVIESASISGISKIKRL